MRSSRWGKTMGNLQTMTTPKAKHTALRIKAPGSLKKRFQKKLGFGMDREAWHAVIHGVAKSRT